MRFSSHMTHIDIKTVRMFVCVYMSTDQHNAVNAGQFIPLNMKLFPFDELWHAATSFDTLGINERN